MAQGGGEKPVTLLTVDILGRGEERAPAVVFVAGPAKLDSRTKLVKMSAKGKFLGLNVQSKITFLVKKKCARF